MYPGHRNQFPVFTKWNTELRNTRTLKMCLGFTVCMWFLYCATAKTVNMIPDFIHGIISRNKETLLHLHWLLLRLLQDHKRQIYQKCQGSYCLLSFISAIHSWMCRRRERLLKCHIWTAAASIFKAPNSVSFLEKLHCQIGKDSGKFYDSDTP